jgi:LPXTG-motif cell wall-anchored protein
LIGATTTTKHFYIDENGNESLTATDIDVVYQNDNVAATAIMVINKKGVELPSTGGIGTTIFYILGSALVIGCGIVLISRKRMNNK